MHWTLVSRVRFYSIGQICASKSTQFDRAKTMNIDKQDTRKKNAFNFVLDLETNLDDLFPCEGDSVKSDEYKAMIDR